MEFYMILAKLSARENRREEMPQYIRIKSVYSPSHVYNLPTAAIISGKLQGINYLEGMARGDECEILVLEGNELFPMYSFAADGQIEARIPQLCIELLERAAIVGPAEYSDEAAHNFFKIHGPEFLAKKYKKKSWSCEII